MSDFQRVKEAINIRDVICRDTGFEMKKHHLEECPFCGGHDCFSVKADKGFYKCHQCDKKGDVFTFLQEYRGMDQKDALAAAAAYAGVELQKKESQGKRLSRRDKIFLDAAAYYHQNMSKNGSRDYFVKTRGHDPEVLKRMGVGYSDGQLHEHLKQQGYTFEEMVDSGLVRPADSGGSFYDFFRKGLAIFPHFLSGRVVHFTMKDPEKKVKSYQLPADKRNKAWVFYNQDALKYDELILVEGENDILSVQDAGIYGVIGTSGQVQDIQIRALGNHKRKKLFIWMDNDDDPEKPYAKGKGYIRKICSALPHVPFRIIVYPDDAKDPDEYLQRFKTGKEKRKEIERLKSEAVDYLTWEIIQAGKQPDMEKKLAHLNRFKVFPAIALESEIRQQVYIEKLESLGFARKAIDDQLETEQDIKRKLSLYFEGLPKDVGGLRGFLYIDEHPGQHDA